MWIQSIFFFKNKSNFKAFWSNGWLTLKMDLLTQIIVWLGSLSLGLSYFVSPILVSWCRRKSARLTAIAGGLMASLGCLFASFASQFHQVFLSYGIFLSLGIGIARESANLMVGQYFKRRRHYVEVFIQSSIGIGIAVMSPFLDWSIG